MRDKKRQIRPYKGGRTERLAVRCTLDVKKKINASAKARNITVSDLIASWVEEFC